MTPTLIPLAGKRFAQLTVLERAQDVGRRPAWKCRCDCGRIVIQLGENIRSGHSKSCGHNGSGFKHGSARRGLRTATFRAWADMLNRVASNTPRLASYYKNRGITVCKRWRKFENFLTDMGQKPRGLTLERKNNNRGYSPTNCRWATQAEQLRNTRRNRWLMLDGRRQVLTDWAKERGLRRSCLEGRLRRGWSIRAAITTPVAVRA